MLLAARADWGGGALSLGGSERQTGEHHDSDSQLHLCLGSTLRRLPGLALASQSANEDVARGAKRMVSLVLRSHSCSSA